MLKGWSSTLQELNTRAYNQQRYGGNLKIDGLIARLKDGD